jgi:hypothetical protein
LEHQEVWAGPSWSSTALRYDVAFIWSIKLLYHVQNPRGCRFNLTTQAEPPPLQGGP